jgi:hypothetical protein
MWPECYCHAHPKALMVRSTPSLRLEPLGLCEEGHRGAARGRFINSPNCQFRELGFNLLPPKPASVIGL